MLPAEDAKKHGVDLITQYQAQRRYSQSQDAKAGAIRQESGMVGDARSCPLPDRLMLHQVHSTTPTCRLGCLHEQCRGRLQHRRQDCISNASCYPAPPAAACNLWAHLGQSECSSQQALQVLAHCSLWLEARQQQADDSSLHSLPAPVPAYGYCRYLHCTLRLQAPWLDKVPPTLKDLMGSIMAYATCASEQQGLTQLSHALDPDSLLAAGEQG